MNNHTAAERVVAGRYRLQAVLEGTGGHQMRRAHDEWSDQSVVLTKVELGEDPTRADALRKAVGREVRQASAIRHPNVAQVLDVVADGAGTLWVVSQWRSSQRSLRTVMGADSSGAPGPARVCGWGRDLAAGLAVMHDAGLVHRCVSPELVAIGPDGIASLLAVAVPTVMSSRPLSKGESDGELDPAAQSDDVRSLAALLHELLTSSAERAKAWDDADAQILEVLESVRRETRPTAARLARGLAARLNSQATAASSPAPRAEDPEGPAGIGSWSVADGDTATTTVVTPVDRATSDQDLAAAPDRGGTERTVRVEAAGAQPSAVPPPRSVPPAPNPAVGSSTDMGPWRPEGPQQGPQHGSSPGSTAFPPPASPGAGLRPPTPFAPGPNRGGPGIAPVPNGFGALRGQTLQARPARRASRRVIAVVGAATLVVVVLVALVAIILSRRTDGIPDAVPGNAQAATPAPAAATSLIGDTRRADPCSLLPTAGTSTVGAAQLVNDYGPYDSCATRVTIGGVDILLTAQFQAAGTFAPGPVTDRSGDVAITRYGMVAGSCQRLLVLPDGVSVTIKAIGEPGQMNPGTCVAADAGTATASSALAERRVAQRPADLGTPLSGVDPCALFDPVAAARTAGLDARRRLPGFGSWSCILGYNSALRSSPYAYIGFGRRAPLNGTPRVIGRHSAIVTNTPASGSAPAQCEVDLVQRSFTGPSGSPRVDTVEVRVQPETDPNCPNAVTLATSAEAKLPAPQ